MFKRHVTLNNFHKRYVTFELDAFAILGFSHASIQSNSGQRHFFDVLQNKHAL